MCAWARVKEYSPRRVHALFLQGYSLSQSAVSTVRYFILVRGSCQSLLPPRFGPRRDGAVEAER